ncbi:TolC family protein [Dyadobacter tibetensis]|uniref:TolC family protein n=1 Tax=Dyadobacter tibetensis TaxID=1211851 RepID=UPI000472B356|nr:TolC family protein [Dyadobacter tibetensis]
MLNILKYSRLAAIICLWLAGSAQAQPPTLQVEEVLSIVSQYHPLAVQARLQIQDAQAGLRIARGGFDPLLGAYAAQKNFGGTHYYTQFSPTLQLPTWFGVELYAGIDNLEGERLNPSQTKGKSSYVGISIPLAKDLLLDKRRAALKQARLFTQLSEIEQRQALNQLLMDVTADYWEWVQSYQSYLIMESAREVNEKRLQLVIQAYNFGERPAIDTVEALGQLQQFQNLAAQYALEYQNATLNLSAHLWTEQEQPYMLPAEVIPPQSWDQQADLLAYEPDANVLLGTALSNHPELQTYDYKLDILDINRRLKFQELLPKADFNYNFLRKGYQVIPEAPGAFFDNNYQYGFKFELPLRLSEGRGAYRQAKIKIAATEIARSQKKLQLEVKIKSYLNELSILKKQMEIQSQQLVNSQKLVEAEEIRYQNGESSLFMINSRENKALEVQKKLIELKAKYFKTIFTLQGTAGLLY